jgi:cephalosporin-C deacetylase
MDTFRKEFWQGVVEESAALPLEMRTKAAPFYSDAKVEVSSAVFQSVGGVEIACWIARPRGKVSGAIIQFPAYATVLFPPIAYAEQGLLAVAVSVRGHLGSEIANVGFPGLLTHGLPDITAFVYRGIYADALRAEALVSGVLAPDLPLALMGQSQGAALSIFVAAMTGRVSAVAADVPFLCDIRRSLGLTDAFPYRELAAYLREFPGHSKATLDAIDLIDILGFAPLVSCPVLVSIGTLDPVTPLAATRALAAALPFAEVFEYVGAGHEGGGMRHRQLQTKWLLDRLGPPD